MMRSTPWWSRLVPGAARRPVAALSRVALDTRPAPAGTDLRWRPGLLSQPLAPAEIRDPASGKRLGDDAALWHDSREGGLRLRQMPGTEPLAPFRLQLETDEFPGSYLSLSIDLPPEAQSDLLQAHILRLETVLWSEKPLRSFGRLNVRNGPNTDKILRDLPLPQARESGATVVEFDLAAMDINEKRLEKIWLDLIFEQPQANVIEIGEMILSRHLRASF